jgi:hypothetical protein
VKVGRRKEASTRAPIGSPLALRGEVSKGVIDLRRQRLSGKEVSRGECLVTCSLSGFECSAQEWPEVGMHHVRHHPDGGA